MPLTAEALPVRQARPQTLTRIATAAVAVALVAGAVAGTIALLAPAAPPPPTRNPFGMGLRDAAPAEHPRILVLGRLVPHKRVEHVLAAAAELRVDHPTLRVAVVGGALCAAAAQGLLFHIHISTHTSMNPPNDCSPGVRCGPT